MSDEIDVGISKATILHLFSSFPIAMLSEYKYNDLIKTIKEIE